MGDSLYPTQKLFDTIVVIRRESDLPPLVLASDGVMRHPLDPSVRYFFDRQFTLVNPFLIPEEFVNDLIFITFTSASVMIIPYSGTDTLFFGRNAVGTYYYSIIFVGVPGSQLFDLESAPGRVQANETEIAAFFGFENLGVFNNVAITTFFNWACTGYSKPLQINNPNSINVKDVLWANAAGSSTPCITVTGSTTTIVFNTSDLQLVSGGSFIALDSGINIGTQAQILNQGFPGAVGTTFFQDDLTGSITKFEDSAAAPGVDTTVTSVDHNLTNFRDNTIAGTTSYNGTVAITRIVDKDRYDIPVVFAGNDATGTFLTTSLDETDTKVVTLNNGAQRDSVKSGASHLSTSLTVTGSGATFTKIGGVNWVTDAEEEFTVDNTGKLIYIGINPTDFDFILSVTLNVAGNNTAAAEIFFNSVSIAGSRGETANAFPTQVSGFAFKKAMKNGDFIEAFVNNATAATDVDVSIANLIAVRA